MEKYHSSKKTNKKSLKKPEYPYYFKMYLGSFHGTSLLVRFNDCYIIPFLSIGLGVQCIR